MKIEQLYTGCLSEAAYYIESEGEAAIIDPLRETRPYIEMAEKNNAKIKYIFETHFHADFVSGHVDLARRCGGTIVYGPTATTDYDAHIATDGEEFSIGKLKIKVLHTPGHTPESSTYLLYDENGNEHAIFTGDTVFIGDVGRPDLAVSSNYTKEDLAGMLYDSIWNKIMPLPDNVIIYPAHGAGSLCGKHMSDETSSTLGDQKKMNYALREMSREDFIAQVTEGIPPAPQYFAKNAAINKSGYDNIDDVMAHGYQPLSLERFKELMDEGVQILDTRDKVEFGNGYVPGSINIGLDGSFAVWVGTLIVDLEAPMLIIAPEGREEETVLRLARVGYDNVSGYLDGGFNAWATSGEAVSKVASVSAEEFAASAPARNVIDVRNPGEFASGHVENATNMPLGQIRNWTKKLDKDQEIFIHCLTGYRSMTAASILCGAGYEKLTNVAGGMQEIEKTGLPLVALEEA